MFWLQCSFLHVNYTESLVNDTWNLCEPTQENLQHLLLTTFLVIYAPDWHDSNKLF